MTKKCGSYQLIAEKNVVYAYYEKVQKKKKVFDCNKSLICRKFVEAIHNNGLGLSFDIRIWIIKLALIGHERVL